MSLTNSSNSAIETFVNDLEMAVFKLDSKGLVKYQNKKSEEVFGCLSHENKDLSSLLIIEDDKCTYSGCVYDIIYNVVDKDTIFVTCVDVTELERVKKKLVREKDNVINAAKLSLLGKITAGMAHEINTPLGTITLCTSQIKSILDEENMDIDFCKGLLTDLELAAVNVKRIIASMRSFGSNSKESYVFSNSNHILNTAKTLFQNSLKRHNIDFKINSPQNGVDIFCNPTQISQVIINLINNSKEALVHESDKWIKLEVGENNKEMFIIVTNSGERISPDDEKKLYLPYFTTKDSEHERGIGLYVVKSIIDNHCGEIILDKDSLHTSFIISLPKIQE